MVLRAAIREYGKGRKKPAGFGDPALQREAGAFFRRTGKSIVLFTVDDILNEHLARKLA
jgi:hypothetical protein